MNVRLYDGTVRCPGCFDSSTYQTETSDPCLYCCDQPSPTESDEQWLEAVSSLVIPQATRYLTITKRQCDRCSDPATWKIVEYGSATEFLCTDHGQEWFPDLFPVAKVTVS